MFIPFFIQQPSRPREIHSRWGYQVAVEHHHRIVIAASAHLDARIQEAWGNSDGASLYSLPPPALTSPFTAHWDLAIVEYALGDALRPSSPFCTLHGARPEVPIIAVSDAPLEEAIVEALRAGAVDCVSTSRLRAIRTIAKRLLHGEGRCLQAPRISQQTVLSSINRILEQSLACETEEQVGETCLRVALDLLASRAGFVGEIGSGGPLCGLGWIQCARDDAPVVHHRPLAGLAPHSPWFHALVDGDGIVSHDPLADGIDLPSHHPPLTAFLAVPLRRAGETIGVLAVANRPGGYTRDHLEALRALSPTVIEVLMRQRAEVAMQASERRLARDLDGMTRLQALSTRLAQPDDLLPLLREILTAAAEITGTRMGSIQVVDASSGALHLVAHQGLSPSYVERFATNSCPAICGAAQRRRCRVIVEDVCALPELQGSADLAVLAANAIRCVVSTPLICHSGRLVGMLNNHYTAPHPPSDHELRFIDLLARMAADVIERSRAEEALRASEAMCREVLENSRDALYRRNLISGTYDYFSPTIEQLYGYTAHEFAALCAEEREQLLHPDDRQAYRAHNAALEASTEPLATDTVEYRLKTKRHGYRWFCARRRLMRDTEGNPIALIGTVRDIEEEKRAQQAIAQRLEDLAALADASQVLSRESDEDNILQRACALAVERFGLQLAWIGLVPEDGSGIVVPMYAAGLDEAYRTRIKLSLDSSGERQPATRVLRTGQAVVVDDITNASFFSPPWRDDGLARGFRSMAALPLVHDSRVTGVMAVYAGKAGAFDHERLQALQSLANLAAAGREKARLHAQVRRYAEDLEGQVAARTAALAESEARFRAVFEDAAMGIAVIDLRGRLLAVNPALEQLLGRPGAEMVGRPITQYFLHGRDREALRKSCRAVFEDGASTTKGEAHWVHPNGQLRLGQVTMSAVRGAGGAPRFAICMIEDITEERQARAALIQAERLRVTGQLTTAFAHEIKNPLQAVIGCLGLLAETLTEERIASANAQRYLEAARNELHRADRVVNRLRDFHRRGNRAPAPTHVDGILEQVLLVTQKQCEEQLVVSRLDISGELPPVIAQQDELRQLFLNLVFNAIDAMPTGGLLQVSLAATEDPPGVRVTIADSGEGIPPASLPHLFEFLYTTKERGTGLGLFVCQEIVHNHGGDITVQSTEGAGTTFTVWLPA